jgi:hypothetical protein
MHTNSASNITSHYQFLATPVKINYEIDIILRPRRFLTQIVVYCFSIKRRSKTMVLVKPTKILTPGPRTSPRMCRSYSRKGQLYKITLE